MDLGFKKIGRCAGPIYGKTREGVPYSAFFEGRRSLGSRRLKCSGFGLQHLWFCYSAVAACPEIAL